ncbi:MAG: TSUP family transporter [Gammaproteobacteria bacterium]|nr:TSUP family transporter [Gammaproteobacteria bacterium]
MQLGMVYFLFVWSGFVRSSLGFGGAAFAMPLMLLIVNEPLLWLPIIANHLLIFSILTVYDRLKNIDWTSLGRGLVILIIPKLIGVFGLLHLPNEVLAIIIYGVTFIYGLTWVFNYTFASKNRVVDGVLLVIGGYASGTSLVGAPLISAVFARHVLVQKLRDTLFLLWMILVTIKVSTFVVLDVDLQFAYTLYFLPMVAAGHWLGLQAHNYLIQGKGERYKAVLGSILLLICCYGLWKNVLAYG